MGLGESMKFVTFLDVREGMYYQAIKKFRNPEVPDGVNIRESVWLFGKPDALLIFDAPDEKTAGKFVVQFGEVTKINTALAFPIDELTWLR